MGQTKYIKSNTDYHALYTKQTQEISFPDEYFAKAIDTSNVYVIEDYSNNPIKLIYNGDKIKIKFVFEDSVNNDLKRKIYKVFNEKYIRSFSKIVQSFQKIPFVIFGDFISKNEEIVIYDMFINDNWISFEHLKNMTESFGFKIPKVIYHGLFDEKVIKVVMKSINSSVNKGECIKYAFIKSEMEVYFPDKIGHPIRLGAIISIFENDTINKLKEKEKILNKAKEIMRVYFDTFINQEVIENWKDHLKLKRISINLDNKPKILSELVRETLSDVEVNIHQISESQNITEKILRKAIKSVLPKYIMKNLSI